MKVTENIYWTITGKVKDGELENMKKAIQISGQVETVLRKSANVGNMYTRRQNVWHVGLFNE